jgi:predicted dehydrogenase
MMIQRILLVGAGAMAKEYLKVLMAQNIDFVTIGRGENTAKRFEEETDQKVVRGGIEKFLSSDPDLPDCAIVCVSVEQLKNATSSLIQSGVKKLLVEKPGGLIKEEIQEVYDLSLQHKSHVYVAYNRRFYASVQKARDIIHADGGVTSFCFEFTEWSHEIEKLKKAHGVKETWFLSNSTHVVDMAFFLGGFPKEISCFTDGGLSWHPSASIFTGAGISDNGALFSYQANWEGPGRWGVEVCTRAHKLIFRPLEKLQIQDKGSVEIKMINIDDRLDREFKPGLYRQVETFLGGKMDSLCTIENQLRVMDTYNRMANYK